MNPKPRRIWKRFKFSSYIIFSQRLCSFSTSSYISHFFIVVSTSLVKYWFSLINLSSSFIPTRNISELISKFIRQQVNLQYMGRQLCDNDVPKSNGINIKTVPCTSSTSFRCVHLQIISLPALSIMFGQVPFGLIGWWVLFFCQAGNWDRPRIFACNFWHCTCAAINLFQINSLA